MSPPPFQAFLDANREAVHRFCVASVGPEEADDVFQETFMAALRAYPRLRDARNLRSWVMTIAHNKVRDAHRARGRRAVPVGEGGDLADGRAPALGTEDPAIWRHLDVLPPRQSTALVLRFAGDLPYREIGAALGSSEAAARQSVREGLRRLREVLA